MPNTPEANSTGLAIALLARLEEVEKERQVYLHHHCHPRCRAIV